ncbi:hypothetical protein PRVXT_000669 [Proteinivorax tanatarense]|uniref:DUF624 domain-containing protein n=1 Tax=Proteinivorax tanatarense TaxID=1260629 RepID=A0AAU7VNK4_9FIRM
MISRSKLYFEHIYSIYMPAWLGLLGTVGLILGISSIEPVLFVPYIVFITLMNIKESELIFYLSKDLIRVLPVNKKEVSTTIIKTFLFSMFLGGVVNIFNFLIALHKGVIEDPTVIMSFICIGLPLIICGTFIVLPNAIFKAKNIWKNIFSYAISFTGLVLGTLLELFLPLVVILALSVICYMLAALTVIKAYKKIILHLQNENFKI